MEPSDKNFEILEEFAAKYHLERRTVVDNEGVEVTNVVAARPHLEEVIIGEENMGLFDAFSARQGLREEAAESNGDAIADGLERGHAARRIKFRKEDHCGRAAAKRALRLAGREYGDQA